MLSEDVSRIKKSLTTFRRNLRNMAGADHMKRWVDIPAGTDPMDGVDASASEIVMFVDAEMRILSGQVSQYARTAGIGLALQMNGHETNSIVGSIGWTAKSLRERSGDDPKLEELSKSLDHSVERLSRNCEFILKNGADRSYGLDTGKTLAKALRSEFSRPIQEGRLVLEFSDAFLEAKMPGSHPGAVFSNLVRNSYYWASPRKREDPPAIVRFSSETFELAEKSYDDEDGTHTWTPSETFIHVEDNGPGIAAEERDDVFRPFRSGRGSTGLGLHISRRMLEQGSNSIAVMDSGELGGARFVVGSRRLIAPMVSVPDDERDGLIASAWSLAGIVAEGDRHLLADHLDVYAEIARERLRISIEGERDAVDAALREAGSAMIGLTEGTLKPDDLDWPAEFRNEIGDVDDETSVDGFKI